MRKYLYIVLGFACALWYLTKSTEQADAFFPRGGAGIVGAASVAISSVQAAGGGGGGGPVLLFAHNGGKFSTGGATSLVITPLVKPSTNSLIIIPAWIGQTTFTSVIDNRGNSFVQDKFDDRLTGGAAAIWHFVATATYNGAYTITITIPVSANINAGLLICSNTVTTASVDSSTNAYRTAATVETGTMTTTSACDVVVSVFLDNSGVNDNITPRNPLIQLLEEQDGSSFQAGAAAYSTTTVQGVSFKENWTLAASKQWNVVTVGYKATP